VSLRATSVDRRTTTGPRGLTALPSLATCQCSWFGGCSSVATQEDFYCDACRAYKRGELNAHLGSVGEPSAHSSCKTDVTYFYPINKHGDEFPVQLFG
jgi:hypothetical protein